MDVCVCVSCAKCENLIPFKCKYLIFKIHRMYRGETVSTARLY